MKKLLLLVIPAMLLWNNNLNAQTALEFDGTDDAVTTSNNLSLTCYTKEVWVKWDGINPEQYGVLSGDASNPHLLWVIGSQMRGGHVPDEVAVSDPVDLVPNEWTHFSVTYDGATGLMQMYKNGQFVVQRFIDPGFELNVVNIGTTDIGNGVKPFQGVIDDVRIWDCVRTPEEIAENYDNCLDGTEEGLVAFYDFEDGAGSDTLSDLTGNGNDGTLVNMDTDNAWVDGFGTCGEEEEEEEQCIEITNFYPNPTWNRVYLNLNGSYNSLQVRVYNCYGYYVRGKHVSGPTDSVYATLSGLRRGYYYVMVLDCETWKYDYVRVYKRGYYC